MERALQRGSLVLGGINTVFIGVDWLAYHDLFLAFLIPRLLLNVAVAFILLFTAHRYPLESSVATSIAGAAMLYRVVSGTGGMASDYYVGLVLLLIGIGVLLPFSGRQGTILIGGLFLGYALVSFPYGETDVNNWRRYWLNFFFMGGAAFAGVMSCAYLDRMRFSDFLQRREIEQARDQLKQLDIAKSRFTANIHHELRTPLTLTLAPVEGMLSGEFGEVSELQRSYLETIRSNGLRLLKLINNLLDLAKIEGQQLTVKRQPTRVGQLIEEIAAGARPLAERKGVALETEGLSALPVVNVDPDALDKIFVNLLGNALKFTDRGGRIVISGQGTGEGGVHLVVADSGIGIPEDQIDRIFDRFAQVDGSSTRRHEGTGIGLSLAKELVELHQGRIHATSAGAGQGTQMHVELPAGEADSEGAEALEDAVMGEVPRRSPSQENALAAMAAELDLDSEDEGDRQDLRLVEMQRNVERVEGAGAASEAGVFVHAPGVPRDAPEVLIVEDNPDMRRLLSHLIGQEFHMRVARNGREGLDKVRERHPDLVLTDVMMPEMSGTELCAAIKGDPATRGIPVVLVTSKAEREMKIEGLERGADDYVTKPFHPRELLARVRSLVNLRLLQAELSVQNARLESTNEELKSALGELREAGAQLAQAERLAAVGELAAGVAHEVNNPVNFAMNAAKTLRTYVDDVREVAAKVAEIDASRPGELREKIGELEALRERLHFEESAESLGELAAIVTEGLERTSRLVSDLRNFAAPGDGRRADVDVGQGLASTVQLVRHSLDELGVEVQLELPQGLPAVSGDARALNQVFLNLLKNAAEAYEGRGGSIAVAGRAEGDSIVVEIRDEGVGIGPEVRDQLFQPFFTTKEAGRGTGLGLSLSRRIVDEHGGRIELESEAGRGTTVRVVLPVSGATADRGEGRAT